MASRSPASGSLVIAGSGGIGAVSGTGTGGAGGRAGGVPPPPVIGGGAGRAIGGVFLPQAPAPSVTTSNAIVAKCVCLIALYSLRKLLRLAPRASRLDSIATSSG